VEWINSGGAGMGNDAGATLFFRGDRAMPAPYLEKIMRIRVIVGDPLAPSIIYDDQLPDRGLEGQIYTRGDGRYYRWSDNSWKAVALKFDDITIDILARGQDIWRGALYVFDNYLAKLDPLDYITSGNAGAQSVSFPSVSEVLAWFTARRALIVKQLERYGTITRACYRPRAVGGVLECSEI
jgi:hypothetical protein